MRASRLGTLGAVFGLTLLLAAPAGAVGHPLHVQKDRDDGPAAVEIGVGRNDPNGSNGTIKIDGVDAGGEFVFDGHPNNEPHIQNCQFQVDFYGYDVGDTADLSFKLWPPSGQKTPLDIMGWQAADPADDDRPLGDLPRFVQIDADGNPQLLAGIEVGGDGAGGGIDIDNQIYIELSGLENPHPQHGYHVKVNAAIHSGERTYKKSKVFWVTGECEPTTPPPTPPPADCTVRLTDYGTAVKISWTAVEDTERYAIKRNNRWLGTTEMLMFTDANPPLDVNLEYFVRAIGSDSKSEYTSCGQTIIPPDDTPPGPPVCEIRHDYDTVQINWSPVDGAKAYQVRQDGVWQTRTKALSWTDSSPGTNYTVEAVFPGNIKSDPTNCQEGS